MAPPHTLPCVLRPPRRKGRHARSHFFGHGIVNPPLSSEIEGNRTPPFDNLPNELLLLIGKSLQRPKDVYALIRTNRRFAALLTEYLRKLACGDRLFSTTALFYAAAHGDEEFVRLLLQKGTQIKVLEHNNNVFSPRYETIHETPDEYCEALFEFILKEGVDLVLEYDHLQFTALRWAVVTEDKTLVTLLLLKGANIQFKTYVWYGTGPLHAAVVKTKPAMVNFLLDNGFDIEAKDFQGYTALQVAAQNRVINDQGQAMIMLLLSRGATVSVLDKDRKTVLHQAAQFRGWGSVVKLLIRKGVPVNARDNSGATALHVAAAFGHVDIVSALLEAGADATLEDYDEDAPLHVAIKHRQENVAYALVMHRDMSRKLCASDDSD